MKGWLRLKWNFGFLKTNDDNRRTKFVAKWKGQPETDFPNIYMSQSLFKLQIFHSYYNAFRCIPYGRWLGGTSGIFCYYLLFNCAQCSSWYCCYWNNILMKMGEKKKMWNRWQKLMQTRILVLNRETFNAFFFFRCLKFTLLVTLVNLWDFLFSASVWIWIITIHNMYKNKLFLMRFQNYSTFMHNHG